MTNTFKPCRRHASNLSLSELETLRSRMTPGEYQVWTSNSFRRITAVNGPDGGVLRGEIQRSDGHPDLAGRNRDADLAGLCAEHNALPTLLAIVKATMALETAKKMRLDALHAYSEAEIGKFEPLRQANEAFRSCEEAYRTALKAVTEKICPDEPAAITEEPPRATALGGTVASCASHTCMTSGRSGCALCMQYEAALWDAINRYAISVGGDPASHVYGNTSRQQAVADVSALIHSDVKEPEAR